MFESYTVRAERLRLDTKMWRFNKTTVFNKTIVTEFVLTYYKQLKTLLSNFDLLHTFVIEKIKQMEQQQQQQQHQLNCKT